MAEPGRLQVGQQVEVHRPVLVPKNLRFLRSLVNSSQVNPFPCHQAGAEAQALRGVVVAADGKDGDFLPGQGCEKPIQQAHRLGGGHRLVVQVPGQQDPVHLFPDRQVLQFL